jgi:hypothetical protein
MASKRKAWGICDICGWKYRLNQLRKNSYNLLVCPTDYDGRFDLKNHPQNRSPNLKDDETIHNARPELYAERNKSWEDVDTNWEDLDSYWNLV